VVIHSSTACERSVSKNICILSNDGGGYMLPRSRIVQHDIITAL